MAINIGNIEVSSFKVGSGDCTIYVGDVKVYPQETPVTSYKWLATYSDSHTESAACDASSAITQGEITLTNLLSVEIGDCVTSIGNFAFGDCTSLSSVTIPNSVTSIGNFAFGDCTSLSSITIPNSVTSIGNFAFGDCTSLSSITIPNSVTSIGHNAFIYCYSLSSVTIPDSVTSIGVSAFYGCSGLTEITVNTTTPPTLETNAFDYTNDCPIYVSCASISTYKAATNWSGYASRITCPNPPFEGKYELTLTDSSIVTADCDATSSVTSANVYTQYNKVLAKARLGDCVIEIGRRAFHKCSAMTSCELGNNITTIEQNAFRQCFALSSVNIPNSVTNIGHYAFSSCSGLTSIEIPSSVTSIGNSAFERCYSLTSVTINNAGVSCNDSFYSCSGLTSFGVIGSNASIKIPSDATEIGSRLCYNSSYITSATIPSGVTTIGESAFAFCSIIETLTCLAETPPSCGRQALYSLNGRIIIYVPSGSVDAYKAASGWSDYSNNIQAIP